MKYVFYAYDRHYEQIVFTRNLPLDDLFNYINSKGQDYWIKLDEDENDPTKIIIWSDWNIIWSYCNIKNPLSREDFATHEDFLAYLDEYYKYSRKRFAEMPAIRISRKNYEELEKQWQEIRQGTPKYLIFRKHDNGYVDILEKNELSQEDIAIMKYEEKVGDNYIKRLNEYKKAHPEKFYPIWRTPADNFFESDFALYDPADEEGVDDISKKKIGWVTSYEFFFLTFLVIGSLLLYLRSFFRI
jgi:hypothetical protein